MKDEFQKKQNNNDHKPQKRNIHTYTYITTIAQQFKRKETKQNKINNQITTTIYLNLYLCNV